MKKVTLTRDEVISILEKIKRVKICLIGDVCLDLYWRADMKKSRLSRETPHFPLPVVDETYTPGGGGNVINNIHALGVDKLISISAIGSDWRGFLLTGWMEEHGIDTSNLLHREKGVTPCYCKPIRTGISNVEYEDPRLDFENHEEMTQADEDKLLNALDSAAEQVDIIAVSDQFMHGVITPRIRKRLSELAHTIPVVVDSREKLTAYSGVIIKPNEVEAAFAIGRDITGLDLSMEEYAQVGTDLQMRNGCPVIVTLGALGALWCEDGSCQLAPTVQAKPPVDIVGAGDTFLSAFCCAYAACKDGAKAAAFANLASAVTVKKIGTTGTASPEEILKKWEAYQNEHSA